MLNFVSLIGIKPKKILYRNKNNNVLFEELIRFDNESVMLRTDINIRLLIPHKELEKHYEKVVK
jgi:hypothetical protein